MKQAPKFVIPMGVSALVACAVLPPATSSGTGVGHESVPATATQPQDKIATPYGYRRVVMDGTERFCRNDPITGSRTMRHEVCLTEAELKTNQDNTRDYIQQVQRMGGVSTGLCEPGAKPCP